jgi:AmiR/NasT family two-component response regulator
MARILLVEDDSLIRHNIARLLGSAAHEVRAVATAEAALDCAGSFDLQLAILDIGLPKASGIWCATQLRKAKFSGPLIFLTADDKPDTVRTAIDLEAHCYLVKPITGAQLLPVVGTALAASDMSRRNRETMLDALRTSRVISAAVGVLAERNGWTVEESFEALRVMARSQQMKMIEVADRLIRQRPA